MLVFVLYLVSLASPAFVFWLVTLATTREMTAEAKEKSRKTARPRRRRVQDVDMEMAVLVAEFIVAPRMAFNEAQELLAKSSRDTVVERTSLIDRRSFEDVLAALATARASSGAHR